MMVGVILAILVSTLPLCLHHTEGPIESLNGDKHQNAIVLGYRDPGNRERKDPNDTVEEKGAFAYVPNDTVEEKDVFAYTYAYAEDKRDAEEPRKAEAIVRATASSYLKSIVDAHGYAEVKNGTALVDMGCQADALSSGTFNGSIRATGDSGKSSINSWLSVSPLSSKSIAELRGEAINGSVEGKASGQTKSLKLANGRLFLYGEGDKVRAHGFLIVLSIGPITMAYTFAYVVALNGDAKTDLSRPIKLDSKKIFRMMEGLGLEVRDIKVELGDDLEIYFNPGINLPLPSLPFSSLL